ncbi:hypothetical protein ACF5W4_14600 [Bacillota bacterium Lsc_1132]
MKMIKSLPSALPFVYWLNHQPDPKFSLTMRSKSFTVGFKSNKKSASALGHRRKEVD